MPCPNCRRLKVLFPWAVLGDSRNFAALVAKQVQAICTSPPYAESNQDLASGLKRVDRAKSVRPDLGEDKGRASDAAHYGTIPGQVGALRAGSVEAVVTSPPYAECVKGDHGETETAEESRAKRKTPGGSLGQSARHGGYGTTPGQVGALKEGSVEAVVTSPPFLFTEGGCKPPKAGWNESVGCHEDANARHGGAQKGGYGTTPGQVGRESGPTYWTAMRDILASARDALRPGGWCVLVIKGYIKGGKLIDLPGQTVTLLKHLGFTVPTIARAWLVERKEGVGLFGQTVVDERSRKSFFRRLSEKRPGAPKIDFETIVFARKPLE